MELGEIDGEASAWGFDGQRIWDPPHRMKSRIAYPMFDELETLD